MYNKMSSRVISADIDQFIIQTLDICYSPFPKFISCININYINGVTYVPREVYNITEIKTLFYYKVNDMDGRIRNLTKITSLCICKINKLHINLLKLNNISHFCITIGYNSFEYNSHHVNFFNKYRSLVRKYS